MTYTAIDLFCGAGGLSAGLEMAGFTVLAGNDLFDAAGRTFEATHPRAKFIPGPIEELSVKRLMEVTGLRKGELSVLVGGPPCQAYSVYNHQRGMHDARASLFREYLRIVDGLRPEWIVMENVTGIYSIANGEAVRAIKAEFAALGYAVEDAVLRAEDYGVPQERRRVVFIGNRVGAPISHRSPRTGQAARTRSPRSGTQSGTCPRSKTVRTRDGLPTPMPSRPNTSARCAATRPPWATTRPRGWARSIWTGCPSSRPAGVGATFRMTCCPRA